MNRLYTAFVRPRYHLLRYAVAILLGYGVGGFYLASCQASPAVWSMIGLLVIYTAIAGTGGVVLSWAGFSSILIVYAVSYPWPVTKALPIPLSPAQIWSSTLLIFWVLGCLLIALLGTAVTEFAQQRRFSWRFTVLLGGLSILALNLGYRVHMAISM